MGISIPTISRNGAPGSPPTHSDSRDCLYADALLAKLRCGGLVAGGGHFATDNETRARQRSMLAQLVGGLYPERCAEIADDLLVRYGSLGGIFSAARFPSFEAICGELLADMFLSARATVIESLRECVERSQFDPNDPSVLRYVVALMKDCGEEQLHAFFLDATNGFLHEERMASGTWSKVSVNLRPVLRLAIELEAVKLVLVHNHPSGDPRPSHADRAFTRHVAMVAKTLGIEVFDHLIVASPRVFSMRIAGMMA